MHFLLFPSCWVLWRKKEYFFQRNREGSQSERDIIKEFVDQSFERERRRNAAGNGGRDDDDGNESGDDVIKKFVDESFEREKKRKGAAKRSVDDADGRDVIKEFVDQSFEKGEQDKVSSPKRELVSIL